LFSKIRLAEG